MDKPCLVVMAAGMGSRYGGLKQMDPVDPQGHIIMDFSVYDAHLAGFETVVFIIKHEFEDAFKATVGARVSRYMNAKYAFQSVDDIPEGFAVPLICFADEIAKDDVHPFFGVHNRKKPFF